MTRADRTCVATATVLAVTGLACLVATVHAQSAEAEVLFRDGRALIKHGQLAAGCDKLAASERLESSVGTLLNLGDCREQLGKPASAWAAFRKAEAMAKRTGGDDRRQAEANRRALQLEPRLPRLEIDVPSRVDGLNVRKGGELVDDAQWNTALPIDPGRYTIIAEAPGYQAWRTTVWVGEGAERQVVVVPSLRRTPMVPPPEPVVAALVVAGPPAPRSAPVIPAVTAHRAGTWSATRRLSVGLAVAGTGALGTAVYFGVHARDLQDRSDRRCPLTVCADLEGLRLNDQAKTSAARANVLYLAGGGTLAAAVVLWFVGTPDNPRVVPITGDHRVGVAMAGRF